MKILGLLVSVFSSIGMTLAGEPGLIKTYQPLSGEDGIVVTEVTCLKWNTHSGLNSGISFIGIKNVPPSDNPEMANEDLNVASVRGLKLYTSDLGAPGATPEIILDATDLRDCERFGYAKEIVVRASLECLRLCLPEKLMTTKITLKCKDADKAWLEKIVTEFDAAPRDKPFYVAP